jgi:hypothetical protein
MTDDLIKRLREAGSTGLDMSPGDPLCTEAADALEALQSRLESAMKDAFEAGYIQGHEATLENRYNLTGAAADFLAATAQEQKRD